MQYMITALAKIKKSEGITAMRIIERVEREELCCY